MELSELLALYDRDQRRDVTFPGTTREALAHVVRHFSLIRAQGHILYSQLDASNADQEIAAQIADFVRLGRHLEWKLYEHDSPPNLRDRLEQHEFEIGEEEATMVLDLRTAPDSLRQQPTHDIRRITNPNDIATILSVQNTVWGVDFSNLRKELETELREYADTTSIYASYADDRPVCSAWMRVAPGSQFASLWGGSTLEAYRGQGHYTALLVARAQNALRRGLRFLTVDASDMSRPILEKLGFVTVSHTYECHWRGDE
jgi:predicted GNAT family acetyltransferase